MTQFVSWNSCLTEPSVPHLMWPLQLPRSPLSTRSLTLPCPLHCDRITAMTQHFLAAMCCPRSLLLFICFYFVCLSVCVVYLWGCVSVYAWR